MKKKLIPVFISALCVVNSGSLMANQADNDTTSEKYYTSMGVGAASGALIAGPVGFLVGGLVGVLFSRDDAADPSVVAELSKVEERTNEVVHIHSDVDTYRDFPVAVAVTDIDESNKPDDVLVASASDGVFLIDHEKQELPNKLKEIITDSLNIVVYYTPGSVTTESFYNEQFDTVLELLQEMPKIELNLAGYSDRRGTDAENVQLASQRVSLIRDYFTQHGIEEKRINIHAYGEKNLLSTSGELDSYMFDRRVVLSFSVSTENAQENVAIVEPVTSAELSSTPPF